MIFEAHTVDDFVTCVSSSCACLCCACLCCVYVVRVYVVRVYVQIYEYMFVSTMDRPVDSCSHVELY